MGTVRDVVRGARRAIEAARPRIDDLNVYPVPDGDTGTNLALTVAAIDDALATTSARSPAEVAAVVRRAALMGARGNSGVILSQIVRGICDVIALTGDGSDGSLAAALQEASDAAYRGVREPIEGTILTVIRAMAEAAATAAEGELDAVVLRAADDAVARTPELLAVLRDNGVVDAGGAGLAEIARGASAGLRGTALPATRVTAAAAAITVRHGDAPSRYRYCTSYVVSGRSIDHGALEVAVTRLGDSVLVVGDAEAVKIHVHTDDPGAALSIGTAVGVIAAVEIADMHEQVAGRARRLASVAEERRATDVVIVVAGAGNAAIARSLGARNVIEGGPTMNPSAGVIVAAADGAAADGVVVLPCDANALMAARAAADAAAGDVHVVEARSIPVGLAALVAYDPAETATRNAGAMAAVVARATGAAVTRAVRAATLDGHDVAAHDWLGLVDDRLIVASSDLGTTVLAVLNHLLATAPGVITALVGEEPDDTIRQTIAAAATANPEVEFEVHDGGQPHYPLLLASE